MGLMLNWFTDLGIKVKTGLGSTWMIILLLVFSFLAVFLIQNILRASINKTKVVFKWGQIFFAIIFLLLTIWFITLM